MIALIEAATSREAIVTLALLGAVIATYGSTMMAASSARAKLVTRGGYAITAVSVLAFIAAGFMSDL